jgi:hypothetical protein
MGVQFVEKKNRPREIRAGGIDFTAFGVSGAA